MGRVPWWVGYWAAVWINALMPPRSRPEVSPRHDVIPRGPNIPRVSEDVSTALLSGRNPWTQIGAYLED